MSRLSDKVAVITGGTSGIGAAMVRRFVTEGARVIFTGLEDKAGAEMASSTGATFYLADVASEFDWQLVLEKVRKQYGQLDVLVNNAGIVSNQSVVETELDTWNRVLAVNVTGAMLGCRGAIEFMKQNPGGAKGSIINVASTVSFLGLPNDLVYTTSKSALVGLTRSIATWCAREGLNVRCNSLHPGPTYTSILQAHVAEHPEMYERFSKMAPMGRMADVDEIANLALYLASDESSYSNGAQFVADGGIVNAHPSM